MSKRLDQNRERLDQIMYSVMSKDDSPGWPECAKAFTAFNRAIYSKDEALIEDTFTAVLRTLAKYLRPDRDAPKSIDC